MLWSVTTRLIAKQTKPRIASAEPTIQASTPPASEKVCSDSGGSAARPVSAGLHRKLA